MHIRSLLESDWPAAKQIYQLGIDTGIATFETTAPEWDSWDKDHLTFARLVAEVDDQVAGWIALSPVSDRCVYGGVAEVSVYVHPLFQGRGVGFGLLRGAIHESEANGIWTLTAAMFPENEISKKLHEKMGFREIGYREKIGQQEGVWKDNVLMERRSTLPKFN